jgi:hypothetical protein
MKIERFFSNLHGDINSLQNQYDKTKKHIEIYFPNVNLKENEFNSLFYRSDEFIKNHEGKHVVFAGCSYTFGSGIEQDLTWPKIVYNKISEKEKCSGYFNLGTAGNSIADSVYNLFKYFKIYGNPNVIFFCMPDAIRFYGFDEKNKTIRHSWYSKEDADLLMFINAQYYFMLEEYCKQNNINLYSFTWVFNKKRHKSVDDFFDKNFSTFYKINLEEQDEFVFAVFAKETKNFYTIWAKDERHRGTAYHEYWAKFIYEKYYNKIGKNNEI